MKWLGKRALGVKAFKWLKTSNRMLVLLDLSLPDIRGLELISDILKYSVSTGVLIVSMHSKMDYIVKSFQYGAMGYIVKESAADTLLDSDRAYS
jgi:DNA-binding NarL/FixJ family response regulator